MADDDLFKRYLEIWTSMLGMSRERAEGIVRDLVASGEVARKEATRAADWLVERGRAGTEELNELVRRQIREQVTALGLATKDDIAGLQTQIDQLKGPPAAAAPTKKATAKKATATKATAKKAPAKKAPKAAASKPAGITRSASAGGGVAGSPPAAGDAVPPKG